MRNTTHKTPNRNQLAFDFTPAVADPGAPSGSLFADAGAIQMPPLTRAANLPDAHAALLAERVSGEFHLVRVLPWDFRTRFPEPVDRSLTSALNDAGDNRLTLLRAMHDDKSREGLKKLARLDTIQEAGRTESPVEGERPLSGGEEQRVTEAFESLIRGYADDFGHEAADAFRTAIRVWHLGGVVITKLPPIGSALPDAVTRASFGFEEDGAAVNPSEEEVLEITDQLADYLRDLGDSATRDVLLHQYAVDFGREAAETLDQWSRCINIVEEKEIDSLQYDPGHPWHYYREGDAAEPMPAHEIPAGHKYELPAAPKNPRKRLELFQQMLVDQEKQLQGDMDRYTRLAEEGADALSDYDRNIAHDGNDDLAWASAIALKFNHIRYGQARVAALRTALAMPTREKQPAS